MRKMKNPFPWVAALACAASLSAAAADHPHWSYAGDDGPERWGDMSREFAACKLGHAQSPIDIRAEDARRAQLEPIRFDYKPAALRLIDNGHTVQVNYPPGSSILVDGTRYELVQFHFHAPSEEKIDGKAHPMVVHLVHRSARGKLAVVAVLVDPGGDNPALKTLGSHLPTRKGVELAPEKASIDAALLLPRDRGYYTFEGSLTTPPCSEGVTWFVLKRPVKASADEIEAFAKLYPANARPVQPLNGRPIRSSD